MLSTNNKDKKNRFLSFWFLGFLLILLSNINFFNISSSFHILPEILILLFAPLIFSIVIIKIYINFLKEYRIVYSYLLFFLISITSLLGFTEVLTGSHAASKNIILYGLSFYSASIAFRVFQQEIKPNTSYIVSNPLLLFTGPLSVYVRNIRYRSLKKRIKYFLPYIILGIFLFQTIAKPLSLSAGLITYTDAISSILFAIIFELFIYANFCGLSLIVYGVSGIFGYKVPLNFKQPFSSNNIIEFWRGWHLSLSLVLKNLFYLPVKKLFGTSAAIIIVFMASALWHGISINFLFWGLLHGMLFITSLYFIKRKNRLVPFILLIIGIILGRMIFADSNTSRLIEKLSFNYGYSGIDYLINLPSIFFLSLSLILVFILIEYYFRRNRYFISRNYKFYRIPVVQCIILFITLITINTSIGTEFAVYGQR